MIGIQQTGDRNTYVPDWFVLFYDSGYFWLAAAAMGVIVVVLIVMICRQYYEWKEAERFLNEKEVAKQKNDPPAVGQLEAGSWATTDRAELRGCD